MRRYLILLFAFFASTLQADSLDPPLPALYEVVGIEDGDALNVRVLPDAGAAILGALGPDSQNIEVIALSREGRWGLVNVGDGSGWVSLRYLQAQPVAVNAQGLPQGLRCFGTEPFWSLGLDAGGSLILRTPQGETRHPMTSQSPTPTSVALAQSGLLFSWGVADESVTARILPGQCSDGMSDRRYGLHYVDGSDLRSGCCSLQ